jgi:hypothetical protein
VPTVRTGPLVGFAGQLAILAVLAATVGLGPAGWLAGLAYGLVVLVLLRRARLGPADRVTLTRSALVGGVTALVADAIADAVAGAVAAMRGVTLLSPYPRIVGAGRLVQPLLQWSWLTFLPLRLAERSPRPSLSAANGQLLAVRRAAYDRAGGHAAVRAEVVEDVALLRAVKRAGGRGGVADGTALADCRMYGDWAELRDGYTKSLWSAFGSPAGAAGVAGLLVLGYLVPPLAAVLGSKTGLAGYAAGVTGRVLTARRTGGRAWPDAFAHPVSVAAFGWLTARSLCGHRAGTLAWKGRRLP